jgi:hypothetical protein
MKLRVCNDNGQISSILHNARQNLAKLFHHASSIFSSIVFLKLIVKSKRQKTPQNPSDQESQRLGERWGQPKRKDEKKRRPG